MTLATTRVVMACVACAAMISLSACSRGNVGAANADASKLSDDLESKAEAIEARANRAAAAAERESAAELAKLNSQREAAEQSGTSKTDSSTGNAGT